MYFYNWPQSFSHTCVRTQTRMYYPTSTPWPTEALHPGLLDALILVQFYYRRVIEKFVRNANRSELKKYLLRARTQYEPNASWFIYFKNTGKHSWW